MSALVRSREPSLLMVAGDLLPAALLVALFVAVGVIHVTGRVMVVRFGYELSRLDQESVALTREAESLKLELATLKSPARLEALARTEFGLAAPGAAAFAAPATGKK